MNEINFSVRISDERSRKINIFTARNGMSNKELMEQIADNIERLPKLLTKGKIK